MLSFFNICSRTHMGFRKTKVWRILRWRTCSDNDVSVLDLLYIVFIKKMPKITKILQFLAMQAKIRQLWGRNDNQIYTWQYLQFKNIYFFFQNVYFGVKLTPKWRHQHYFWLFSTFLHTKRDLNTQGLFFAFFYFFYIKRALETKIRKVCGAMIINFVAFN